ncbi:MAG TPA: hypothetical protein VIL55_14460 [Naasia sp.]
MGTNRRYGSDLSKEAINEAAIRPRPLSLTQQEAGGEVREAPEPVAVTAWVRFPEAPIEVEGRAVAWTDRAVLVEFRLHSGAVHKAWVWASAVTRR